MHANRLVYSNKNECIKVVQLPTLNIICMVPMDAGAAASWIGVLGLMSRQWNQACGRRDCGQPIPNTGRGQWHQPKFFDVVVRGWAPKCEGDQGVQEKCGVDVCRGEFKLPIPRRCCYSTSPKQHHREVVGSIFSHKGERGINNGNLFCEVGGHRAHFSIQATPYPSVNYAIHVTAM